MALSRRTLASGRALLGALAATVFLRRSAQGQPTTPGMVSMITLNNLATLRAYDVRQLNTAAEIVAHVAGYIRPGDGGGGTFEWLANSTALDEPNEPNMAPIVNVPSTMRYPLPSLGPPTSMRNLPGAAKASCQVSALLVPSELYVVLFWVKVKVSYHDFA